MKNTPLDIGVQNNELQVMVILEEERQEGIDEMGKDLQEREENEMGEAV